MAIVSWGPLPQSISQTLDGRDVYDFKYKVSCNTTDVSGPAVIAKVTEIYGHYCGRVMNATRFYCESITADQDGTGLIWTVTVHYAYITTPTWGTSITEKTPLNDPWKITLGHTTKRLVLAHAFSKWYKTISKTGSAVESPVAPASSPKYAVVNSAGLVFDPQYEDDTRLPLVTMSKNITLSAFNGASPLQLDNTINGSAVHIVGQTVPAYAALLWVEGTRNHYIDKNGNPVFYMAMSYTVTIDWDLWATRLVDQGFKQLDGTTGKHVAIKAAGMQGQLETKPTKLDGEGHAIAADSDLQAVLACFFTKRSASWGSLDLPSSISAE